MLKKIYIRVLRFGLDKNDEQVLKAKKQTLNYMFLIIGIAGFLWAILYISLGFYLSSIFPLTFPLILILFLKKYQKNKKFEFAVNILLWSIFLLPILLQLSIGNFTDSGGVIAWSFCAPIGALLFKSSDSAIKWFLLFLIAISSIAAIQVFIPYTVYTPKYWVIALFYLMNIGAVLVISFTAFLYFSIQLNKSNLRVTEKSKELRASIETASLIQKAIIGDPRLITKANKNRNYFMFCKPRDIVCGDFLWIKSVGNKDFFIVVDSSLKGVPGALLTLLGNNALNDIILNKAQHNPTKIIEEFLIYFNENYPLFKKGTSKNIISMHKLNIGILVMEKETKNLTYSGLNNTALQIVNIGIESDEWQVIEFLGDEIESRVHKSNFTNINPINGSMIYLSTNGFEKQLDSKGIREFKHKKFCNLLTSIAALDLPLQEKAMEEGLKTWRKNQPLTEDVLVLGIRL